jgi:competence protein ComEA
MKFETRSTRAFLLVVLATVGVLFAASPLHAAADAALTGVVNINTATAEELQLLPGIGESRAKAVLALRKQSGGFKSVDELAQVKGIGTTVLDRMRPYVRTQGKTTARKQ